MMRTAGSILGILLAGALGACAHHNAQNAGAQAPNQAQPQMASAGTCPLAQLPGVHATVADIGDGVAITFTAPQSELDQLRQNVHAMADSNDKQGDPFAACPCGQAGAGGSAEPMPSDQSGSGTYGAYGSSNSGQMNQGAQMNQGTTMAQIPAADAKVDEIPTGAVLELQSKDKTQISALRMNVRQNVHALKQGCLSQSAPSNMGEQNQSPNQMPNPSPSQMNQNPNQ